MKQAKNVLLEKVVVKGFRFKRTKKYSILGADHPKEGYRKVLWVTCPKGMKPDVIECLVTRKAQKFARILNTLSYENAIILVKHLHDAGRMIQVGLLRETEKKYSGRSFEHPRM